MLYLCVGTVQYMSLYVVPVCGYSTVYESVRTYVVPVQVEYIRMYVCVHQMTSL